MRHLLLALALLGAPALVRAQDAPPPEAATPEAPSPAQRQALLTSLQAFVDSLSAPPGYVREVFAYPRFGRLDPVEPPATVTSNAAFPELRLTGIVFDEKNPARSAAILRVSREGVTTRRVVRVGETIDQYRVVGVEPNRVLIDVYVYGGVRRMTLDRTPETPAPRRSNP